MNTVSKRLKGAIENSSYTYRDLEKMTGIGYSVIYRYANGETDKIPVEATQKLSAALCVNLMDDNQTNYDLQRLELIKLLKDITKEYEELGNKIKILEDKLNMLT